MKRHLDISKVVKWTAGVGGIQAAAKLIREKLECSDSKAQKIAAGRYPKLPPPLEQLALAALMNVSRDQLFPLVAAKGSRKRAS